MSSSLINTGYDTLAISGNNIYAADLYNNTVGEYTTSGTAVHASLITGLGYANTNGLAISGSTLYVSTAFAVGTYSLTGTPISPSFVTGSYIADIAISGNVLFVLSTGGTESSTISEYNATTGALINSSLVSGLYDTLNFTIFENRIYTTSYANGTVTEYTTAGVYVTTLVSGLGEAGAVDVAAAGNDVFVTDVKTNAVNEFNATTGAPVALNLTLPFGAQPTGIAVVFPAWTGAISNTWAGSNWNPSAAPGTGNTAIFKASSATVNGNTTIDLGTGVTVANIFFDTPNAAAYTLGKGAVNSQSIKLNDGGGITMSPTAANNELFDSAITLGTDATAQTYILNNYSASNSLTLAGNLTGGSGGTAGAATLLINTTGNTTINGVIRDGGTTGLALVLSGTGTLTLSGLNLYTGGTTLNSGVLQVASDNNLGGSYSPGGIFLDGGELLTTTTGTFSEIVAINTGTSTLAASNGTTQTYSSYTTAGAPSAALIIGDGVNTGTVVLLDSNTYGGGTTVASGVLQVNNSGALGAGPVTVEPGTTLHLYGDGDFEAISYVAVGNNITVSGSGFLGQGALVASGETSENGSQAESLTGTVTLAADTSVGNPSGEDGNVPFGLGPVNLSNHTLTLLGSGGYNLTGAITGSGGITMNGGYVSIQAGNTYTGNTDALSGTQLDLDASGTAIPGNLTIEDGAVILDDAGNQLAGNTVMTLNGDARFEFALYSSSPLSETLAGLQSTSATTVVEASPFEINFFGGSSATLTLEGSGNYAFAGQITDFANGSPSISLSLIKQGSGTQTLSGNNTYAGETLVQGGELIFTQSLTSSSDISVAAGATLNLSYGTFTTPGSITNGGTVVLGYGVTLHSTGTFTNNGTIDARHDPAFTLPGNFVNNGVVLFATPQTLSQWETTYPNLTDTAPNDSPKKDAIPTLLKYLSDIDPTQSVTPAERAALPTMGMTTIGQTSYMTLTYRQYSALSGTTVEVQSSPDMQTWTTVGVASMPNPTIMVSGASITQTSNDPTTGDPMIQAQVPITGAKQFIRLRVTQP